MSDDLRDVDNRTAWPFERARPRRADGKEPADEYELPPRPEVDASIAAKQPGPPWHAALIVSTIEDAFYLGVDAKRALWKGKGDEAHPVLVRCRYALKRLTSTWGYTPEEHVQGQKAASSAVAFEGGLHAAQTLSIVAEEGDAAGRRAILSHVRAIRASHGWHGASLLGRAVIDQYALACVHTELVRVCAGAICRASSASSTPTKSTKSTEFAAYTDMSAEDLLSAATKMLQSPLTDDGKQARHCRSWECRLDRAEKDFRRASRLVRHARKAGWLPREELPLPPHGDACIEDSTSDPLASLAAPVETARPPLRGEAAEVAQHTRDQIAAMQAAWPPPGRISRSELQAPDCPWHIYYYHVEDVESDEWWVYAGGHPTPKELIEDLASWAPEYAATLPQKNQSGAP